MPKISVYTFNDLTPQKLYEILKLRQDVFIIEQHCPYNDLDNLDQDSLHILIYSDHTLAAYSRILPGQLKHKLPSVGRIVVHPAKRGQGFGKMIIFEALEFLKSQGHKHAIIEAQEHLENYYKTFGFFKTGSSYALDGIPHIKMVIKLD